MNPLIVADNSKNLCFSLINCASRIKYMLDLPKYNLVIKRNKDFKNRHSGKKCFILGNGPSIRNLSPDLLKGQIVFAVNAMLTTELFEKFKPTYHCIIDKIVYQKYKNDIIKGVKKYCDTQFFLHRSIYDDIGLKDNVFYIYSTILPTSKNICLNIEKNANSFINVLPCCIMIAIFMGFTEIVLLGCDFNFFAMQKDVHFYEIGKNIDIEDTIFQRLFGSAIACQQYAYLYEYAKSCGVSIVNATPNSLLDVIPRVDLSFVL